jgi:hypothetical protein
MSDPKNMLDGLDLPETLVELLEPLLLAMETGFHHAEGQALRHRLEAMDPKAVLDVAGKALALSAAQTIRVDRLEEQVAKLENGVGER